MRALLLLGVLGLVIGCQDRPATPSGAGTTTTTATTTATRTTYTREDFKNLVMGKTPDEVIAAVGKPDRKSDSGVRTFWYYDNKTTDSVTGKTAPKVQVVFRDGKVTDVTY